MGSYNLRSILLCLWNDAAFYLGILGNKALHLRICTLQFNALIPRYNVFKRFFKITSCY